MPLDAVTLRGLKMEIQAYATDARIDRIQQPEKELLIFSLYTKEGNRRLILNASVSGARVHFTEQVYENPSEPPMFCMLLRKHLAGARIRYIEQPDMERVLLFHLNTRDEMGDESEKTLAVEMIGRSPNIILIDSSGRIIDCLRRMEYGGEGRGVLPGLIYRLPPKQNKTPFFECTNDELDKELSKIEEGTEFDKELLNRFSGLSPLICRELAYRSRGDRAMLMENAIALRETVEAEEFVPTMVSMNGKALDYSFMAINQYGKESNNECFISFSSLLDTFYIRKDREEIRRRRSREILRTVKSAYERLERKISLQRKELLETAGREEIRQHAELITANIYRLKKGQSELKCENYFEESCPEIRIKLDPLKTPQQNAAALYRDFSRKKAAEEHLTVLIAEGEKQRAYLETVLDEIERAENERDLGEIRRELIETGYIKKPHTTKSNRIKPQAPLRFLSSDGYEILVGRSNIQNDDLTFHFAKRSDVWLHAQKIHGSHVILRTDDLKPTKISLQEAALLAAYYSQGREAGKITIDYTQVRHVKKPSGALPGAVIYTDYSSIQIDVSEETVAKMKRI